MRVNKIDHSGKTIFVGIYVHKKTYTICSVGGHMPIDKAGNIPADPKTYILR